MTDYLDGPHGSRWEFATLVDIEDEIAIFELHPTGEARLPIPSADRDDVHEALREGNAAFQVLCGPSGEALRFRRPD